MLTRCPACHTTFRVTPEQLKARQGRVRCGACDLAFDAFDTLLDDVTIVAPAPTVPEPADAAPEPIMPGDAPVALVAPAPDALPEIPVGQAANDESPEPFGNEEAPAESEPMVADAPVPMPVADESTNENLVSAQVEVSLVPTITTIPVSSAFDEHVGALPDAAPAIAEPPPSHWSTLEMPVATPRRRWPWLVGCLGASLALLLQGVYLYRVELAVLWPDLRPTLDAACQPFGCSVGLPRKGSLIAIEASDLHPDNERKGQLTLSATLKNRAPFAQEYPHLELTLTDTADKAVARKVVPPASYLPTGLAVAAGMAPSAELALVVGVDPGTLAASGYRLYAFYP